MPGRTGPVDGVDFPGRDGRQTVSVRLLCHETRSCRDPPFFLYFGSQLDRNSPFQVGCGIDRPIYRPLTTQHSFSMSVTLPPPRAPLTSLIVRLLACYDHSLLACHSLLAFLALQALLLVCMISCTLLACLRWSSDIPLLSNTELFAYNEQVMSVAFP